MVLVRLRSQGDAMLRRAVVPWALEDDTIVLQSVEAILPDLAEQLTVSDFVERFEIWTAGRQVDLYGKPGDQQWITPGAEVYLKPRNPKQHNGARAKAAEGTGVPHQQHASRRASAAASSHTVEVVDLPSAGAAASNASNRYGTTTALPPPSAAGSGASVAARTLFEAFLNQQHMSHTVAAFHGIGVHSLVELCCRTSSQVGVVVGDELLAFRLITAAHAALRNARVAIDWTDRISKLYQSYNPSKASQVRSLMQAYAGEEEELWRSIREKYEPDQATRAATMEATAPGSLATGRAGLLHSPVRNGASLVSPVSEPPQRAQSGEREIILAPASQLVRSKTTPLNEVVHCPACRHSFVHAGLAAAVAHAGDVDTLQRANQQERQESRIVAAELSDAVERLTSKLADAQQVARHYESVCREQEQWIKMLEQRVEDLNAAMGDAVLGAGGGASSNHHNRSGPMPQEPLVGGPDDTATAPANGPPLSAADRAKLRRKLVDFYLKYSPNRVEQVDIVLQQWRGREAELERLVAVEPTVVRLAAGGGVATAVH